MLAIGDLTRPYRRVGLPLPPFGSGLGGVLEGQQWTVGSRATQAAVGGSLDRRQAG